MYDISLASYWSQQEQALQPSCIVRTGDLNAIAAAVEFLGKENHQKPGSCPFAVRSGGLAKADNFIFSMDSSNTVQSHSLRRFGEHPSGYHN
jgi:hypothetical protein